MTHSNRTARPAMTAIAAALALFATPSIAQETTSPAEPVVDAPTEAGPAPTADPLAPEPAASEAPAEAEAATPPATTRATRADRPAARRTTTARAAPAPAAAPPQAATTSDAPAAEVAPAPLPAETLVTEPVAPTAAAQSDAAVERAQRMDLMLAIAGAAVAILVLGLLWMLRRRRRRAALYEEQEWVAEETAPVIEPEPAIAAAPMAEVAPAPEPRFAAPAAAASTPRHDPVSTAPATDLPEGFDLSRFGPHMQAAYRGPTPDNPSLSLRYRLSKAAALDQRERLQAEQRAADAPAKVEARPASAEPGFLLGGDKVKTTVRRAFSE